MSFGSSALAANHSTTAGWSLALLSASRHQWDLARIAAMDVRRATADETRGRIECVATGGDVLRRWPFLESQLGEPGSFVRVQ